MQILYKHRGWQRASILYMVAAIIVLPVLYSLLGTLQVTVLTMVFRHYYYSHFFIFQYLSPAFCSYSRMMPVSEICQIAKDKITKKDICLTPLSFPRLYSTFSLKLLPPKSNVFP